MGQGGASQVTVLADRAPPRLMPRCELRALSTRGGGQVPGPVVVGRESGLVGPAQG